MRSRQSDREEPGGEGNRSLLEDRMQSLNVKGHDEWSTTGTIYGGDNNE